MSVIFTPELKQHAASKAAAENCTPAEMEAIFADSAEFLAAKLGGDPQIHLVETLCSDEGMANLAQKHQDVFIAMSLHIAQNHRVVKQQLEEQLGVKVEEGPTFMDRMKSALATTDKYGGLPFYYTGFGLGYGVRMVTQPVLDLVEMTPLLGHIVSGARDGNAKAGEHYTVCANKAQEWLKSTKEQGEKLAQKARDGAGPEKKRSRPERTGSCRTLHRSMARRSWPKAQLVSA